MNPQTALIALKVIELIVNKGIPAYMRWEDGMKLKDPTLEDVEKLKIKKKPEDF